MSHLYRGMDTPLFNMLVFSKIKKVTGGRLKVGISGGGPIDSAVQVSYSLMCMPKLPERQPHLRIQIQFQIQFQIRVQLHFKKPGLGFHASVNPVEYVR